MLCAMRLAIMLAVNAIHAVSHCSKLTAVTATEVPANTNTITQPRAEYLRDVEIMCKVHREPGLRVYLSGKEKKQYKQQRRLTKEKARTTSILAMLRTRRIPNLQRCCQ